MLNYIKGTERIELTLWYRTEPHFKTPQHSNPNSGQRVGFLKLKHEERDNPADHKLEVSKLINNVSFTALPDCHFKIKEAYSFAEVQQITLEAARNLKTHLKKHYSLTNLHLHITTTAQRFTLML